MSKTGNYYKLEEKISAAHLKGLSNIQTFKIGLDVSNLAMRMFLASFKKKPKRASSITRKI